MREEYRQSPTPDRTGVDGVNLEFRLIPPPTEGGDHQPIVLLHEGLGSTGLWVQKGRDWPLALAQASGRAVWMYSRRGYGNSDPIDDVRGPARPPGPGSVSRHGRHLPDYMAHEALYVLPRLLQAWGVERPVLVGHSDGATIALLHASAYPVAACVAMAPHVFVEDIALHAIAGARDAYLAGSLRERLSRHHANVDNAFWQWNDIWLSDAFRTFDVREACGRITAPLLLVQGRQDEYGTLDQLAAISRAAPHARQLVLDDCGHSPHRDQFDALTLAVSAFLEGLP